MPKATISFSSATLTFHVHATEDDKRILEALNRELPIAQAEVERDFLKGHFDNPIIRYTIHLIGEGAQRFADEVFRRLDEADKRLLITRLDKHIDEHGILYLRIDKQLLLEGKLRFSDRDSIRIKLKPKYRHKPQDLNLIYHQMLTGL
ncbi:MAG: RNA-binding domain-containing protein [Nitrososphaerota archaeon]